MEGMRSNEAVMHWDTAFWAERLREQKFDYTGDPLRPYFPLPKVLDGLFGLGGSRDPLDIYREFPGREPSTEALLRHNGLLG